MALGLDRLAHSFLAKIMSSARTSWPSITLYNRLESCSDQRRRLFWYCQDLDTLRNHYSASIICHDGAKHDRRIRHWHSECELYSFPLEVNSDTD